MSETATQREQSGLSRLWEAVLLSLVTLIGAGFRLYRLTEIPPGLHFDEAFKGVMARGLLQGGLLPLYFASNRGEEPLAVYLVAAVLALGGREAWMLRLPSAIVGTLTIPLAWWLGRGVNRLTRRGHPSSEHPDDLGAHIVGLGTALVLAILYWHVSLSRLGMEPILVPFFITLTFAALLHGLNADYGAKPNYLAFIVAGVGLGGGFYTYKAGYVVPLVVALFLGYGLVMERGFLRRHWRGLLLFGVVAAVVALPLGLYFASQPGDFTQRFTDVTPEAGGESGAPWQAAIDNLPGVLGMFFIKGDANPRSNLPGRPALDPFLALLFLVGVGRAVAGFRRPAFVLPVIWLGIMILPTLVTEFAPHFPRAIGAVPALALLCAFGGWTLWQGACRLGKRWATVATVLLAVGLLFSGVSTARDYFRTWSADPGLFYAYDEGLANIADYASTVPPDEGVYITPTRADHYTLHFLIDRPFATFDGRAGLVLPPSGQAATLIILEQEDGATGSVLERLRPDASVARTWVDDHGRPYATAYHLPGSDEPGPQPTHPSGAILGEAAELMGYTLDSATATPGDTLYLTLYWRALEPLDQDYTVFVHLLGEHNPATGGPVWAGHDGQPVAGRYPTSSWQPGEVILDVHPLTIPVDAPPGEYQIEAGLYLLETLTRLAAQDAAENPLPDNAIVLDTIVVGD